MAPGEQVDSRRLPGCDGRLLHRRLGLLDPLRRHLAQAALLRASSALPRARTAHGIPPLAPLHVRRGNVFRDRDGQGEGQMVRRAAPPPRRRPTTTRPRTAPRRLTARTHDRLGPHSNGSSTRAPVDPAGAGGLARPPHRDRGRRPVSATNHWSSKLTVQLHRLGMTLPKWVTDLVAP